MKKIKAWFQHNFRPLHLVGRLVWHLPAPYNRRLLKALAS